MGGSKKIVQNKRFTNVEAGFYKDYDINWLRKNPDHPDFHLVAEFDGKNKKEDKE